MKIVRIKTGIFIFIAAGFLLSGTWASAGSLPVWGGTKTTTQPVQPTAPGQTNTPAQRSFQTQPRQTTVAPATGTRSTSPPPGTTGTLQPAAPAKKARYRITLNGFKVFAQKGILPGRGHSYYVAAKILKYSQWGAIISHQTKATKVIGHINKFPGAIKAGTATNKGGFRNGDTYPSSIPYAAQGAYNDRLPLVVWEGILEEGGDVVVVEPTIWEKRNGQDIFRIWHEQFPTQLSALLPCSPDDFYPNSAGIPVPPWTNQNPAPIDNLILHNPQFAGERVCANITSRNIFRPMGRNKPDVIAGYTENTFPANPSMTDPHGVLFNYSQAEMIASETRTEPVVRITYEAADEGLGGFPSNFIRANNRDASFIPAGGIQPFWFGTRKKTDPLPGKRILIRVEPLSNAANFYSATIAHPVIPDSTAVEMYLKIQKLPL